MFSSTLSPSFSHMVRQRSVLGICACSIFPYHPRWSACAVATVCSPFQSESSADRWQTENPNPPPIPPRRKLIPQTQLPAGKSAWERMKMAALKKLVRRSRRRRRRRRDTMAYHKPTSFKQYHIKDSSSLTLLASKSALRSSTDRAIAVTKH